MGAVTLSTENWPHFVTYVGSHTSFTDRFLQADSACAHFANVKSKGSVKLATLHLNHNLTEVYLCPEVADKSETSRDRC